MKRIFLILFLAMIIIFNINNSVHASVLDSAQEEAKDIVTEATETTKKTLFEQIKEFFSFDEESESSSSADEGNVDSVISGADEFIQTGKQSDMGTINENSLNSVSSDLYNLFFLLGTILAVIIGVVLGIQFVTSGVEGKAKVKEALIAYVIGCCVIFGSVAIWKICINTLGQI